MENVFCLKKGCKGTLVQTTDCGYMFFSVTYANTADTLNVFYYYNYILLIETCYSPVERAAVFPQEVASAWCLIICSEGQSRCFL